MKNTLLLVAFVCCFLCMGGTAKAQKENEGERASDISELTLSKSFKGESVETTKKIPVSVNYKMLKLQLRGVVKTGTISITLIKPNGNKFKTIEIDAASDVTFEQELNLRKNHTEWIGDWQLKIQTDKAEGNYHLNISMR